MDRAFDIGLVEEEENSGWTILSTVHDQTKALGEALDPDRESVESLRIADDPTFSAEEKSYEENECSDDAEEVMYSEGDDDADDEWTEYGVDEGGEEEESPFSDTSARTRVWETDPIGEAIGKQTLVEQRPVQKQGLIWQISLVATLGLFGWAVLSGFGSGGRTIRCLKTQPCNLKEGEPVLSTI